MNKQLLIVASMKEDGPAARSGKVSERQFCRGDGTKKVRVGDLLETIDGVEVQTTDFGAPSQFLLV